MTEKTDRMVAKAKLDRVDELMDEVEELDKEMGNKLAKAKQLHEEARELKE